MTPDQLTPQWLSSVLDIDVSSVRSERIGDGLVGLNLRLSLEHSAGDSFPDSVVVKLPSLAKAEYLVAAAVSQDRMFPSHKLV